MDPPFPSTVPGDVVTVNVVDADDPKTYRVTEFRWRGEIEDDGGFLFWGGGTIVLTTNPPAKQMTTGTLGTQITLALSFNENRLFSKACG